MTWEEKIDSLAKLAKAAGKVYNTDPRTEGRADAMQALFDAYGEFCEWRHEEPYVVDEIKQLLELKQ